MHTRSFIHILIHTCKRTHTYPCTHTVLLLLPITAAVCARWRVYLQDAGDEGLCEVAHAHVLHDGCQWGVQTRDARGGHRLHRVQLVVRRRFVRTVVAQWHTPINLRHTREAEWETEWM